MQYLVRTAATSPGEGDAWDSAGEWSRASVVDVSHFHAKSSAHRPVTRCKVMRYADELHVAFQVHDRFVRCVHDGYQDRVSRDSCVEFFIEPRSGKGYFNFEWNCGGAMLLYYIEDPARAPDAIFRKFTPVPKSLGERVSVSTSLPRRVEPEIGQAVTWTLRATIPLGLLSEYVGPLGDLSGQRWRGNFFKCGDETSHPHWASWAPIGEQLRFHQPQYFAPILFE
jgi:hypothetical protein